MRHRILFLICAFTLATLGGAQQTSTSRFDGSSWWGYVKVLADDNMEGRETGSEGLRKAEAFTVEQLEKSGLQPAGEKGFYQTVEFDQRQVDERKSFATLVHDGDTVPLVLGEDAYFSTAVDLPSTEVTAPLVFVGYGLNIPEKNDDDFAGLDLKGKVVVYISGSPESIPGALSAHSQTAMERGKSLRAAGAIGVIRIFNPAAMDAPWARIALNRTAPAMQLADPKMQDLVGIKVALTFNPAQAEKLFAGSAHTFAELAALAKDRKPLPRFSLPAVLKAHAFIDSKTIRSDNIIARLPGTDPVLKNEYVLLSAHIDHLGIGAPINGDSIYNGAMDNGSGSALLLDIAAHLKAHPEKLRRSVLFVFVTAEEKGLLGSRYFAAHPTVDARSIVADINTDMFLPIVPLKTLMVLGIDESTLGARAAAIADSVGVHAIRDPMPLRNIFIRSDQYSFVLHGVPSVMMSVWAQPGSPEEQVMETWLRTRYHAPSDDLNQPVDLQAAALYEEIVLRLLTETANADARPRWNDGSFFRRYATEAK
ncbi:MAG TPA: M28 family metallopeptidase [Candidatus Acidoferrum sp.]